MERKVHGKQTYIRVWSQMYWEIVIMLPVTDVLIQWEEESLRTPFTNRRLSLQTVKMFRRVTLCSSGYGIIEQQGIKAS